ncbi:IS200/IS605 family transposase [Leptolyngbya sp. 7M]|uniref:IS200/IS605 family transposase n=1 Tax=Leptolyngbya sp. 7M TaxID=2812896 RepID=UPI001B8C291E|nr:IS200/IS605 family transposase [Leptolyngbya sp. 7M]QYO62464.1 IS200/IS605 family transposase [Leptolyngbya sp. 7M]
MSIWRTYYHLVWATYNRLPLISEASESELYCRITSKCESMECRLYAIGGIADHVHLVVSIPPKLAVAEFARQIKGSSSRFMNQRYPICQFAWQREYGVFSLGSKQLDQAITYVQNQKSHHASGTILRAIEPEILNHNGPNQST